MFIQVLINGFGRFKINRFMESKQIFVLVFIDSEPKFSHWKLSLYKVLN